MPRRGVPPFRMSAAPLKVVALVTLVCSATNASVGIGFSFRRSLFSRRGFFRRCSFLNHRHRFERKPGKIGHMCEETLEHTAQMHILHSHGFDLSFQFVEFVL